MIFEKDKPLLTLLEENLGRYPKLSAQDAVKLLYQRNSGPGHMISSYEACLARLRGERRGLETIEGRPLCENLGRGFARLNLNAPGAAALDDEAIAQEFMRSASADCAGRDELLREISRLEGLCRSLNAELSPDGMRDYLASYIASGCPAVSHSEGYRRLYAPAYRVLSLASLERLGLGGLLR